MSRSAVITGAPQWVRCAVYTDPDREPRATNILTEISRGVGKWLWFVEAHQQGGA